MKQTIASEHTAFNDDVMQPRRRYNQWVADEMLEDFALRHTARRARRWSFSRIANTALGTSAFLVLELLGATIAINYGVYHSLWAIAVVCTLLFLSGLPISYYATKYSVDIDLLTRGAGFGYIGSTISSLIYASFTFIFFALEAAILASALELLLGIPMWFGYIVSALVVIPLVTHGIAIISRFQLITQPIWLLLQTAPIIYIAQHPEGIFQQWLNYTGEHSNTNEHFSWITFGAATTVLFALVAQIGEQVDFLRFLPEPSSDKNNLKRNRARKKWWAAIVIAGPGWVLFGAVKLCIGTIFAYLLLQQGLTAEEAADPTQMYWAAFGHFGLSPDVALLLAAIFVIVCQVKINVANAYAGSLAWSNFFSRLTHHHPGRVVWLIFNVAISLMLMELGVYRAIDTLLHHYSVLVLAWFGSIVADLVINKPLGLSPKHIEFKRSKLYDINPVGVCSTILAATLGFIASTHVMGEALAAFSGFIAFFLPFLTVPTIAYFTAGKYYLVKTTSKYPQALSKENNLCSVCQNQFDREDISHCPAYKGSICSLCCALETRCKDQCRPGANISAQVEKSLRPFFSERVYELMMGPIGQFLLIALAIALITFGIFYVSYATFIETTAISTVITKQILATCYLLLLILIGVLAWLFVLAQKSTHMAQEENDLKTQKLSNEITAHKLTLNQLELARKAADSANTAKSNYITSLSHELRTPLNVILGYAQLLQKSPHIPEEQKDNLSILHRNGEHLATLIEGLLEISKIKAGRLNLNAAHVRLDLMLEQLVKIFRQQAESKGLSFNYSCAKNLPNTIKVDEKRLRQILMNLLSNAIKFTERGSITFSIKYRGHVARFNITDTGYGISENKLNEIFTPFMRGENAERKQISGSGLGLTICRQLANIMGAEIEVSSQLGIGSTFTLLLQASPVEKQVPEYSTLATVIGYQGKQKTILVVDDNKDHRTLLLNLLQPIGFRVLEALDDRCVQIAESETIDLVLLDVRLGNISGWDIAEKLRERCKTLPIIMVSANARGFFSHMPNKSIHDDYLEKPLQLDALLEKIASLISVQWNYERNKPLNLGLEGQPSKGSSSLKHLPAIDAKSTAQTLIELARIGNLNGILDCLNELENNKNRCNMSTEKALLAQLRHLAKTFDFEHFIRLIKETMLSERIPADESL